MGSRLILQNLDLISVGVSDEGHLALTRCELFSPLARPDFDAPSFEGLAILNNVRNPHTRMHQVFRKLDFKPRRVSQLKKVLVPGQVKECQLISLRGVFPFS